MARARKGVYAAVATPLDEGLRPDLAKFVRYSRTLLADGLDAAPADQPRLQKLLADVRRVISQYNLISAVKAVEAWRSGDESWTATIPPNEPLTAAQADALRAALSAIDDAEILFRRQSEGDLS